MSITCDIILQWGATPAQLTALGAATLVRDEVWRTEESLWRDVVEKGPGSARAQMNFGLALIVLMLTRPEGIFPNRQRAVEMRGDTEEELEQLGEDALIDRPLGGVRA